MYEGIGAFWQDVESGNSVSMETKNEYLSLVQKLSLKELCGIVGLVTVWCVTAQNISSTPFICLCLT